MIVEAQNGKIPQHLAHQELLERYWRPVYCYVRRKGLTPDAAEDAVQGLFAQLLERHFLERLDPDRGSLRGFLKKAADNYLINLHARGKSVKRGGNLHPVDLDSWQAEQLLVAAPEDPGTAFDREWALGVMERALRRLSDEYRTGRRRGNAEVVLGFFGLGKARSYAEAATESGMSASQFKAALHRARARFRDLLSQELGEPADGGGDGLRGLFRALA